ncbi:hypothetical protein Tco_0895140 [Tanacetum coccineum]|uniref:Uncharacterized protein n=1 Tax=Tanacetum coccineum TaxID=301880 RepID=A0ABQ5CGC1_9ASTR
MRKRNPNQLTSCIKQFWATAKVKTVNEEVQIQALVDGKKVIITETSVRRALHLKDTKGTNYLPTATIFAELERMWKQRKDSGPIEPITDEATNEEHVSTLLPMIHIKVENTNTFQAAEIATLKERVKKLENKRRSRTYKPRRLYKVGLSRRIESSDDASLGAQESAMVNTATTTSSIPVSAADPVTTAGEVVTPSSVEILEELTLAQTLIEIKSARPKAVTTAASTATPASSRPKAK